MPDDIKYMGLTSISSGININLHFCSELKTNDVIKSEVAHIVIHISRPWSLFWKAIQSESDTGPNCGVNMIRMKV